MSSGSMRNPTTPAVHRVDATTMGERAADILMDLVRSVAEPVIGVATGSSPSPLYHTMARRSASHDVLRSASWFALDEYVGLPVGHPPSYAEVIRREIVEPLQLDRSRVHVPDPHGADLQASAAAYEKQIASAGGVDLQILGIGRNGHLAFNEPGAALDSRTRVERLTDDTRQANRRFFDSLSDVPTHCLTQGLGTILEARHLLLLAQGREKANALRDALTGPVTPRCPASVLQLHPRVTVLVDEEAGSLLAQAPTSRTSDIP